LRGVSLPLGLRPKSTMKTRFYVSTHACAESALAADGTCRSDLFDCNFRLVRSRNSHGRFVYDLIAGGT
jgi:hypothetical protein